jgi:hypothetical protein
VYEIEGPLRFLGGGIRSPLRFSFTSIVILFFFPLQFLLMDMDKTGADHVIKPRLAKSF